MNVLIVDDEELIVHDLTIEVNELFPQASIDVASNATEVLSPPLSNKEYDVAMLDIDMPGMDGLMLAKKLIAKTPTINIIFITGHSQYALDAHELYCSAFLLKPVGIRKLKKAFENLRKPFLDKAPDYYASHYQGNAIIGKKIESYRQQRGISRNDLAELMSVTRQTIYRWEQGERMPDILTLEKLAMILGVELAHLLDEETIEEELAMSDERINHNDPNK